MGSISGHLLSSMGRIARSRYDLRIANLGRSTSLSDRLRGMKVRVYDLGIEGPLAFLRRVLSLRRLVRNLNIALLHTYGHAGPVARLAAGEVPLVSTLPDPDTGEDGLRGRVQSFLERKTAPRAARLLAPSDAMRRYYTDGWGVTVEVLPKFLDVPVFRERVAATPRAQARMRLGVAPEEVVLLHVGRGGRAKGLDGLMDAFHVARVEHQPLRLFLTGQDRGIARARARAKALGLGDAVVFLGVVEDVAPLYAAADLFLLPSHREGWNMSLLEAMAVGLPAIATREGGIPELAVNAGRKGPSCGG